MGNKDGKMRKRENVVKKRKKNGKGGRVGGREHRMEKRGRGKT